MIQRIEVIGLTRSDLQDMINEAIEKAKQGWKEEQKAPPDWEELTLGQASEEFNCCKRTLRNKMKKLNIKGLRAGKEITLPRKDWKKVRLVP